MTGCCAHMFLRMFRRLRSVLFDPKRTACVTVAVILLFVYLENQTKDRVERSSTNNRYMLSVTKVIVIAYYRGGSSLLGRPLDRNHHVMYYFEPFATLLSQYKARERMPQMADVYVDWKEGVFRPLKPDVEDILVKTAEQLLDCEISELPSDMLTQKFFTGPGFAKTTGLVPYRQCMELTKKNRTRPERMEYHRNHVNGCRSRLQRSCDERQIRVFKTIRMTLQQAYRMLEADPSLKVIYSTRDPFGMISSRVKIDRKNFPIQTTEFRNVVHSACVRVRNDLKFLPTLCAAFPHNVYVTNYETLSKDKLRTTLHVYEFIGLDMPGEVTSWLLEQSKLYEKSGRHDNQTEKWRGYLTQSETKIIEELCGDLINGGNGFPKIGEQWDQSQSL